jgi:hypothetical protein
LAALAPLLAVLGFDPRRRLEMPRHFYRSWLILLRPAESAVRRIIVMAARGIVVKLKLALETGEEEGRVPAFGLIDPLKRFAPADFEWSAEWGKEQVIPRISVPGLFDPVFPQPGQKAVPIFMLRRGLRLATLPQISKPSIQPHALNFQ